MVKGLELVGFRDSLAQGTQPQSAFQLCGKVVAAAAYGAVVALRLR